MTGRRPYLRRETHANKCRKRGRGLCVGVPEDRGWEASAWDAVVCHTSERKEGAERAGDDEQDVEKE